MALGVGIIGCGNISAAYLRLAPLFKGFACRACADIDAKAAAARAREFGLRGESVDELLAAEDIDIVVNLTVPSVHYEVSRRALAAGKHVYSEKPFVLALREGKDLARLAARRGLRVGAAPDTFLGGGHQHARHLIDAGAVGRITSGTAFVMSHGMEHWHPSPDFFYRPGAGPVLDVGPYYVTNLIQLIGPVRRVVALSTTPSPTRTITSKPRYGQKIPVETPTTVQALLEFASGATVSLSASWDVWSHGHSCMELYGETGTITVPDPNFFGGEPRLTSRDKPVARLARFAHPFSVSNERHGASQLPGRRPCRHGAGNPAGPAAPLFAGTGAACGRGDDRDPEIGRKRTVRRNDHHLRPADAARHRRRQGDAGKEAGSARVVVPFRHLHPLADRPLCKCRNDKDH
jgi:predicted dehydrogenase